MQCCDNTLRQEVHRETPREKTGRSIEWPRANLMIPSSHTCSACKWRLFIPSGALSHTTDKPTYLAYTHAHLGKRRVTTAWSLCQRASCQCVGHAPHENISLCAGCGMWVGGGGAHVLMCGRACPQWGKSACHGPISTLRLQFRRFPTVFPTFLCTSQEDRKVGYSQLMNSNSHI